MTSDLTPLHDKLGNTGKVGIVGNEKGLLGEGGGTDNGVGEFQPVMAAQVKGQFNQSAVVMDQGHDCNPLAEAGKAGAIAVG